MTTILIGYKFVSFEQPYFVLNTNLRYLYENLPWDWINHKQIRISKIEKKKMDLSNKVDFG